MLRRDSKSGNVIKNIRHNLTLLKTSWRYQGRQFFENSTLHGIRYIAEDGRPLFEKLMWFCCVSVGAIATIIIIVSLWGKFQTNPTITGLDTDFHSWDVPFPAITLCDVDEAHNETYIDDFILNTWPTDPDPDFKKEFLLSLTKLNYNNIRNFSKYIDNPQLKSINQDLRTFIFNSVKHCEDLLSDCVWKNEAYNCCKGFFPLFTENGFCYTFNSRSYEEKWPWQEEPLPKYELKYIQETDIKWSFRFFSTSQKMLVYIHNSDEVPSVDTNPQHIWDRKVNKISFSVKHTYTTEDTKQLSIKQRHCIFPEEVKLKIDEVMYTYTACTRECRMKTSTKLCGCVPIFYPLIEGFKHCNLKELGCVITNLEEIRSVEKCSCELGCSNTVYEVEKLTERGESLDNALEAEFVSWPMVRYKREVLFGWVDLLVSFGGIAGLFLGFSLLSGVEIIYYFTIRACCMVYRDREEVEELLLQRNVENKNKSTVTTVSRRKLSPIAVGYGRNQQKSYRFNFGTRNRIIPVVPNNATRIANIKNLTLHPPFGIEFLN